MKAALIPFLFARKRTSDTVSFEGYAAETTAFAMMINIDDFVKADHGS
jgi:hypothetical protein